jgi:hypothetical protein
MSKGKIILAITFILSIAFSSADSAELRWEVGAKGGVNWGKLVGDPVSFWYDGGDEDDAQLAASIGDFKTGFTGGGFLTVFLSDWIGIQGEVMYIQKGGQGTATGEFIYRPEDDNPRPAYFNGEAYIDVDYVEFPLMAVFEFGASDDSNIRLRALAGTTFAFSVHADRRLKGTAEITLQDTSTRTEEIDEEEEIGPYVKSFEFGLIVGGAVYWDIGAVDLLLESRWENGLTTLDNTTLARDIRTNNINILLGFSYPFGG